MKNKALLLSLKPRFADAIFSGEKRFELRRVKPKLTLGDLVLVYVTAPRSQLEGAFEVSEVFELELKALWSLVSKSCALSKAEFLQYYEGKEIGYAVGIKRAWQMESSVGLDQLRAEQILPPQGYRYLSRQEVSCLLSNE